MTARRERGADLGPRLAGSVRRALRASDLRPGDGLLVAVSGGVDSVVLLHLLQGLAPGAGLRLVAAHLDHGLRGAESAADAAFVVALCARLNVPLLAARRTVHRRPGESLQAAARRVRYRFLRAAARRSGARAVATAHHADDLAETVLMRLLAGAGSAGLAAMARPRPGLLRPLLDHPKGDLIAYAKARSLTFREDGSNRDPKYARNRLRTEVLPALAAVQPNVVAALGREARLLADEADFIARAAAEAMKAIARGGAPGLPAGATALARAGLAALHPAVARRLVADLVARLPGRRGTAAVEAVLDLARGPSGRVADLGGGVRAEARYGLLVLAPARAEPDRDAGPVTLRVPGLTPVPWAGLSIEAAYRAADGAKGWIYVDPKAVTLPLVARPRRAGDRFRPAGMGGRSRSLKRLLIDRKVPRDARDRSCLVVAPEGIVWVVGLRQDGRFMVQDGGEADRAGPPPLALRGLPGRRERPGRPGDAPDGPS
jgi:tRNA(Ile)-lysidine synthase